MNAAAAAAREALEALIAEALRAIEAGDDSPEIIAIIEDLTHA